jgi:hypothetical protein
VARLGRGFGQRTESASAPGTGAELQVSVLVGLSGCFSGSPGEYVELAGCLAVEGAALHGAGFGLPVNRSESGLWMGVLAGPAVTIRLERLLRLRLELQAGASPVRPEVVIKGGEMLHRTSLFFGRTSLGLEVRLP